MHQAIPAPTRNSHPCVDRWVCHCHCDSHCCCRCRCHCFGDGSAACGSQDDHAGGAYPRSRTAEQSNWSRCCASEPARCCSCSDGNHCPAATDMHSSRATEVTWYRIKMQVESDGLGCVRAIATIAYLDLSPPRGYLIHCGCTALCSIVAKLVPSNVEVENAK